MPATQPPFLPGRTSRADSVSPGAAWPASGLVASGPVASAAGTKLSSMASGVAWVAAPAAPATPAAPAVAGPISDSSDSSQVNGRGRGAWITGAAAVAAVTTSATACLQSSPTGQLHSPASNTSPPSTREKYTVVPYRSPALPRTYPRSASIESSHHIRLTAP